MKTEIKSICFFFPHGIGDVVMATPIVIGLREKYPDATLTIVVRSAIECELFGGISQVHEKIVWDIHKKHSVKEMLRFMWTLRKRKFDLLVFDHGIDNVKSAIFSKIINPRISVGEKGAILSHLFTIRTDGNHLNHKVINNWKILEVLGINKTYDPYAHFEDSDLESTYLLLKQRGLTPKNFLVIHPGSGAWEAHKRWPAKKYHKLLMLLFERFNYNVIIVGGPDEKKLCDTIAEGLPASQIYNFAGLLTIRQLAALLSMTHLIIGNDSGVMHIASAVGANTVSIFGPTPHLWSGPFKNNKVITLNLSCAPCYLEKQFGCGKPICLENLSEFLVFNEINALLNEKTVETNPVV